MKPSTIFILIASIAAFFLLVFALKRHAKKKANQEQVEQFMREDALNRALENRLHHPETPQAQRPVEVQYSQEKPPRGREGKTFRLTEVCQGRTVVRQYLSQTDKEVFLGAQDGHAGIFPERTEQAEICCMIFPLKGVLYVRALSSGSELVHRKRRTPLHSSGFKLCNGDVISTPYAEYKIEFL